ncbi:MAG: hypothetical protein MUF16_00220 [Burkholderiaceae bacterium]|nr:hypothetical protein [Burkholderiaceae bacterium]
MTELPDTPVGLLYQLSARVAAQELALGTLFEELVRSDRRAAERALTTLRGGAALPMGSGVAAAIEALAAEWQAALDALP